MIGPGQGEGSAARWRIGGLAAATIALAAAIAGLVIAPLRRQHHDVREEIARVRGLLAASSSSASGAVTAARLRAEVAALTELTNHWQSLYTAIRTFDSPSALPGLLSSNGGGRIDFKVALYDTRERLAAKAQARQVAMPADLGLPPTLETEQRAEKRLWQLATAARLVDQAIDLGFREIARVRVFDPSVRPSSLLTGTNCVTFPVEIHLHGTVAQSLAFLDTVRKPGSFFTVDRVRLESENPMQPAHVEMQVTCSAVVFMPDRPPRTADAAAAAEEAAANGEGFVAP